MLSHVRIRRVGRVVAWAGTVKAEPTDRQGTVNHWMNLRL